LIIVYNKKMDKIPAETVIEQYEKLNEVYVKLLELAVKENYNRTLVKICDHISRAQQLLEKVNDL